MTFLTRTVRSLTLSFLLLTWFVPQLVVAQSASITFNVRMNYQIEQEAFNPERDFVDVAGTFNNWGSTLTRLEDPDGDSVYTVVVDGFSVGSTMEYKFRLNGRWDGREEFPGTGNNRVFTVADTENSITKWYNGETPPTGPPSASFLANPRTYSTGQIVQFSNQSSGDITDFIWKFEGAVPSRSNAREPAVVYKNPGSFDVQLIARDTTGGEADTLNQSGYITILDQQATQPPASSDEWWNERVFYEIFVRSFYDSDGDGIGDLDGLRQKLDYLNDGDPQTDDDLGITGIWLMPINNSPSYHGYDVTDYRSINPDYGTMQDFREFLAAAHDRGIAVIVDYVMNHSSNQHPWFQQSRNGNPEYRDFYRWRNSNPGQIGPWGQQVWHQTNSNYFYGLFWSGMPDLNYKTEAVKDSMFATASYWLDDVGVDGFRLDAALYIEEEENKLKNTQGTFDFWQDFNRHIKKVTPNAFAVGEAWDATSVVLQYVTKDRLDLAFEFDLAGTILSGVQNNNPAGILGKAEQSYRSFPRNQFATFLTNHDQNRVIDVLNGEIGQNKTAAALYLTLPGVPFVYYGEEVAMRGTKPDRDIRRPMQWSSANNAGFTEANRPWHELNTNYPAFNVEAMRPDSASLFNTYRRLIHLRNNYTALRTGGFEATVSTSQSVLAYVRTGSNSGSDEQTSKLVVHNLADEQAKNIALYPSGEAFVISADNPLDLLSNQQIAAIQGGSDGQILQNLSLGPRQTVVFDVEQQQSVSTDDVDEQAADAPRAFELKQNFPNPFNPSTTIQFQLNQARQVTLTVYNAIGQAVATLVDSRLRAGSHQVQFDAANLSSGIYLYRLSSPETDIQITRKMVLVK